MQQTGMRKGLMWKKMDSVEEACAIFILFFSPFLLFSTL